MTRRSSLSIYLPIALCALLTSGIPAAATASPAADDDPGSSGPGSPFPMMTFHNGYSICVESSPPMQWTPCGGLAFMQSVRNPDTCRNRLSSIPKWNRLGCPDPNKPACRNIRRNRCQRVWTGFVCGCESCKGMAHFQPGYEYTEQCVRAWCRAYNDGAYEGTPPQPAECKPQAPGLGGVAR